MKAARESAGIGTCPAQLQDSSQRSVAAPVRPDATSRLKELLDHTLMTAASSGPAVPLSDEEARFASSAFKQGPAATYVPLPSRWGSFEADNVQDDERSALPKDSESSVTQTAIPPTPLSHLDLPGELMDSKKGKHLFGSADANANVNDFASRAAILEKVRSGSSSDKNLQKSTGPSPSTILRRQTERFPCTETAGVSRNSIGEHSSKGSGRKVATAAGAHAINERTKVFVGSKKPSGSVSRNSFRDSSKQSLPGGIKLPSAIAKLLPEASMNVS